MSSSSQFRFRVYVVLQIPRGTKEYHRCLNPEYLENGKYKEDHVISFDFYIYDGMNETDCRSRLISEFSGYKFENLLFFTVDEENTKYTPISEDDLGSWLYLNPIIINGKKQEKKLYICAKPENIPDAPGMIQKLSTEWNHSSRLYDSESNTVMSQADILRMIADSDELHILDEDGNEIDLASIIAAAQSSKRIDIIP